MVQLLKRCIALIQQEAKYDGQRQTLRASFDAHHEDWVKQIVANVLAD